MMVICVGNVLFPPLISIRENPEFHEVSTMDRSEWSRCFL